MKELTRIAILLAYILILYGFKIGILNRLKNKLVRCISGMILVHLLYLYTLYLSAECEFLQFTYDEISSPPNRFIPDIGIFFFFIPTAYAVILLMSSENKSTKKPKKSTGGMGILIAFILLNMLFTIFAGLIFNCYLSGQSIKELLPTTTNGLKDIKWKYMLPLLIGAILFYFMLKHEHNKDNIDDIIKELKDDDKRCK